MPRAPRPSAIRNVSRRTLLAGGLALGGGLVLAMRLRPALGRYAGKVATGTGGMPPGTISDPRVFVAVAPDGTVSIVAARAEMGAGSARTSLPMIVAEEMEADWSRVTVVQAPGDEQRYGSQDTDGSRSMRHFLQPMRECGAAARMMLEAAAARRWGIDPARVAARDHAVVDTASGRRLGFGELAAAAAVLPVPARDTLVFKDPQTYRYVGKGTVRIVDLHDITVGLAAYGADHRLPGQRYAVIARPPVTGGRLVSFDATAALRVPGVEHVTEVPGWQPPGTKFLPLGGVAVVARNTGAAILGREALRVVWDDGPNKDYESDAYRAALQGAVRVPGQVVRSTGDVDEAMRSAAQVVSAEYYIPHLAHATMEPPAALVRVADGTCEAWAPVQSPGGTRDDLARLLDLPAEKVTLHTQLLGGGFGRKSKCDYVLEAALLSKQLGVPVQVQWTREDDIRHGFYHAVAVERIEAALDADRKVVAWRHRSAAPSTATTFKAGPTHQAAFEASMGLLDVPFDIPNIRCETGAAPAHTRIGWFRSVYNIPHGFAVQSFVAELAHATGRDAKDMLLELIGPPRLVDVRAQTEYGRFWQPMFWNYGESWDAYPIDTGRLRRVAEVAAEQAGWGRRLPPGHGLGIAAHRSFVSYVATVVEVAVAEDGSITVPRVDTAIDCGFHVNPERIASQVEGAAVMGLTLAKYGEITFKDGRVQQGNFDDYQMVRIDEAPRLTKVHIVRQPVPAHPGGVGEPPLPPFAPALCNAIFAATGRRIRRLPIGDQLRG
ncbi:MAG TPA: molybdopterin cofactor-binding domain-containing protein [Acetobacteraceae bacterium]|nr:molybdopterin cofactor-binding domain-containing protein [Acetobacteraceae bacterium]